MGIFAIVAWVFYRVMLKEPIFPWKEKKSNNESQINLKRKKKSKKKHQVPIDEEPSLFEELFEEVSDITNHMIRFKDNSFSMIAEVEPVNYFLKSAEEQEAIDIVFESWLAASSYSVTPYLQNRLIDITEPIQQMKDNMKNAEDLNTAAISYGQSMINDLLKWQAHTPRYETKVYLIFTHKIKPSDINADSQEELEEKLLDKTFTELMRRLNAAKAQLRKAEVGITLLPTEGIYELLYHTFNRRKAVKQRFKDLVENEKDALYITADQTDHRIETVKEAIEENEFIENETAKKEESQKAS